MSKWSIASVEKLKKKIETHGSLINNETTTRYALIDPVLKELGWRLDDPDEIRYEEGTDGRWDYNLSNRVIIEAKKIGRIKERDRAQLIHYCLKNKINHGVLTDGDEWSKWTISSEGEDEDFRIRITKSTPVKVYASLDKLKKDIIKRQQQSSSTKDHVAPAKSTHEELSEKQPKQLNNTLPISELQPDMKLPVKLWCESNGPIICKTYRSIVETVANYLIDKGLVTIHDCPIPPNRKNPLIVTENNYKKSSIGHKKCHGVFYLNVNFNKKCSIKNAVWLINKVGLDTCDFQIERAV